MIKRNIKKFFNKKKKREIPPNKKILIYILSLKKTQRFHSKNRSVVLPEKVCQMTQFNEKSWDKNSPNQIYISNIKDIHNFVL